MRARRRHPLAALAAGAVAAGSVLLFAPSAEACSCASRRTLEEGLADGDVIAILSRVDADRKSQTATLRVERTLDGTLPAEVTGEIGYPERCDETVAPGEVTARLIERRDKGWQVAYCHRFLLGDMLQRMAGDPAVTSRGPAVLLAAGYFVGARLAAVDSAGDVVAWDARPGFGQAAAACPGADSVVAVGRGEATQDETGEWVSAPTELTVHDAVTLDVRRTVRVPLEEYDQVLGLRCRDARGEGVDVLVAEARSDDPAMGSLLSVDGDKVATGPLGAVVAGAATAGGFLMVVGGHPASLVQLGSDGSRRVLGQLPDGPTEWSQLVLSPDEATVAVGGSHTVTGRSLTVTVDVVSGGVLADRALPYAVGYPAVWSGPDRLLLWRGPARQADGQIRVVDRRLRTVETLRVSSGDGLTAVGGQPVTFGGFTRLTAHSASGPPRMVDELRLVGTQSLVPLPALADHPFAPPVGLLPPKGETVSPSGTWSGFPFVLGGGAAAVVGLALLRRRRKAER